jgi:hypothetical protein
MVWVGVSYGGVRSLVVVVRVRVCPALYLEVYGAEPRFGIEKLGAVCVYPYPNMLVVVYCGIPKLGVKTSMVVRL